MAKELLREFNDEDKPNVIELLNQVTANKRNNEQWEWLYKKSPAGKSIIVLAGERNLVGQCAFIPIKIKIKNETCLGCWNPDSVVAPEFQRKGIFTGLVKKTYELAKQQNIQLAWGFPNANSHAVTIEKLSWIDLHQGLPLWVKPLNLENLLYRFFKHGKLLVKIVTSPIQKIMETGNNYKKQATQIDIKKITYVDAKFDDLWARASTSHEIMAVRDKEYLTWRYFEKPGANYEVLTAWSRDVLEGYIVLSCEEKFGLKIGHIVDILVPPENTSVACSLIAAAIKHFSARKMDIVSCLMLPKSYLANALKSEGFFVAPKKFLPSQGYLGMTVLSDEVESKILTNPINWYITWGDSDFI
jgi:hypothetical protein